MLSSNFCQTINVVAQTLPTEINCIQIWCIHAVLIFIAVEMVCGLSLTLNPFPEKMPFKCIFDVWHSLCRRKIDWMIIYIIFSRYSISSLKNITYRVLVFAFGVEFVMKYLTEINISYIPKFQWTFFAENWKVLIRRIVAKTIKFPELSMIVLSCAYNLISNVSHSILIISQFTINGSKR